MLGILYNINSDLERNLLHISVRNFYQELGNLTASFWLLAKAEVKKKPKVEGLPAL